MTNLVCSERRKHTRYPGSEMIGCSCCVLASFPGPAQLSVACSTVRARGESGNETSGVQLFSTLADTWLG